VDFTLTVNGHDHQLAVDARTSLLDLLRDHLALTGTKKGCDHGQCGACTVLLDGRRVVSCLTLAVAAQGRAVTTIEGRRQGRRATSDAASLHRSRRVSVRLLHAGTDYVGNRLRQRGSCEN
jgi:aerobic-type carbon monoxide dehydrogenase small subunit (CoxS/CutS family)